VETIRKVKCAITGEDGTNETFIKIGNKYYKSQEIYDEFQRKKILRQQIIDFICYNLLDYQKGQKFPSLITNKLKDLEFYDNEVILKAFQDYENDIVYWMNHKNFTSSAGKIGYMFAIVNNHINDIYDQWKRDKKQTIKEEKSEIQVNTDIVIKDLGTNKKGKDISEWLEDD
jgi:hypothetical protein